MVIAELIAEVGPLWHEQHQARPRQRAVGAEARHRFVFVDRLLVTLVGLRHGTTHDVLACWFGVDRSTITRAIGEVRPLLAQPGCTVARGIRLRTLAEVIEHLGASDQMSALHQMAMRSDLPACNPVFLLGLLRSDQGAFFVREISHFYLSEYSQGYPFGSTCAGINLCSGEFLWRLDYDCVSEVGAQ